MIALLLAEVALERVTKQTELLIDDGVAVSQLSNEMRDELQDLERASRQYLAIRDRDLLLLSERRWDRAHQLIREIKRRSRSRIARRSEEHTSELQSLIRISYAVFCLKKKKKDKHNI